MKVISRPRAGGKTTELLDWMRKAARAGKTPMYVAQTVAAAREAYASTCVDGKPTFARDWQFVGLEELGRNGWPHGVEILLAIDNLDLFFGVPVGAVTFTEAADG